VAGILLEHDLISVPRCGRVVTSGPTLPLTATIPVHLLGLIVEKNDIGGIR
jgi:hypothetical protein